MTTQVNTTIQNFYQQELHIDSLIVRYAQNVQDHLSKRFEQIDEIAEYNQLKVLHAMQQYRVSEAHLCGTTGYGYDDLGRDTLEKVYASIFHTQSALVRAQIISGTCAITTALAGNLRPGDELLLPAGKPYDTMEGVIGMRPSVGSLAEYGITHQLVELLPDGSFDYAQIHKAISPKTKLALIQRSKGYQTRPSFPLAQIGALIQFLKQQKPDLICMVDNCYGEFVEMTEPTDVGADLVAGSLIKNPGGGLAPIGGYIVGKQPFVENAAYRLTAPGLGREVGASLGVLGPFYQGLFLAPTVTASAHKGAVFTAALYEGLGYMAHPSASQERTDIVQAITFGDAPKVCAFCRGIQAAAPIDAHVVPQPWAMPGYEDPVIMAAGAFVSGASIELSADAPMREPYTVYFQGGLTWQHAKYGAQKTLQEMVDANELCLTDVENALISLKKYAK
ncbi:MAG: methionine gamma-lyase family protein [Lachnospiraceae bacterium]|nr:methionine gamma-lyase family protein [Lachnospiraceae bacterium]